MPRKNWQWVGVMSIWFFRQVGDISPNNPEYFFRMVDTDFTPRPVYLRVTQAAHANRQVGPGQYEETNPALSYKGDWSPRFDSHASAGEDVTTTEAGAQVTLKFVGDALDLILQKRADAGRMVVAIDGQNVAGLPRDAGGKSYIELADGSQGDQWQAVVHVARGLRNGEHIAQLTSTGDVNLDGVIIPAIQIPPPPWILIGAMIAIGVLGAGLLVRELQAKG
jgi:hypothetical protein